ncbi:MAG: sulfotransferase [Alphaproteobacteria bacterium]|nr:sulfotransferase [Alphaproteobacteria bacterium]
MAAHPELALAAGVHPWACRLTHWSESLQATNALTVPLRKGHLMAAAERRTGLSDWGAWPFHDAFDRFLDSARDDARLNLLGRTMARGAMIRALSNHLQRVEAARRTPEALTAPLRRPIVIASPPRTGSTLLQRLLASHPDAMSLPLWLAMQPFPPPSAEVWAGGGDAGRVRAASRTAWATDALLPRMKVLHETGARLPVECTYLMLPTFMGLQWWSIWPVYSYGDWLVRQDGTRAYTYLRESLQLLQHQLPGTHWVLKAPGHFTAIRETHDVLPEALIVQLHRDPAKVVPSVGSMLGMTHHLTSNHVDFQRTSDALVGAIAKGADRSVDLRRTADPARFVDVGYRELTSDPLGVAERIVTRAGLRWDPEVRAALQGFLDRHPANKHGRHRYDLSAWGYSPDSLRERFAAYMDRFDVRPEPV